LSDLGGVIQILYTLFGILLLPISEHSYVIKAIQKLFMAQTKKDNLFEKPKSDWVVSPKKT
jgi:hypothetical protein